MLFSTWRSQGSSRHQHQHEHEHELEPIDMAEFRSQAKFGLDKELADHEASKREPELEAKVRDYVEQLSGKSFESDDMLESLKDGVLLCLMINHVKPGAVRKINESKMPFKMMENISNFLRACRSELSMTEADLFTVPDLYDRVSIVNVTSGIVAFSRAADRNGFKGPSIAPKEARKGLVKRWSLSKARFSGVSRLNMGSAGIMDRSALDTSRNITFGAEKSGPSANPAEGSRMNNGSRGIMQRMSLDRSRNLTFGADASGPSADPNATGRLAMGSRGVMERSAINRPMDATFGADAGRK
ncbi:Calponin-1 [Hondaea fermentalgiana]|uniref:Calponin-1 n=1 Tax=Hondaea fermentalgiana TaxID=2315210 RepID=A0A2R5G235_9STRA|nr:Calponin-1 [Hondaea fermentalgiana]|eukprot:GBG25087.1 Calponin-1 [Hondaea fermentalgiana]